QILAEADLHVFVGAMIFLADRDKARRRLDAEALQLPDDGVVLRPAAARLLVRALDGGLEEIEAGVRGIGGIGRVIAPAILICLDEAFVRRGRAGRRVGEVV